MLVLSPYRNAGSESLTNLKFDHHHHAQCSPLIPLLPLTKTQLATRKRKYVMNSNDSTYVASGFSSKVAKSFRISASFHSSWFPNFRRKPRNPETWTVQHITSRKDFNGGFRELWVAKFPDFHWQVKKPVETEMPKLVHVLYQYINVDSRC